MTHDAETDTTLQQFLRTISMATPHQVVVTAAKAADHIDAQDAKIKALVEALELMRVTYPYNPPCHGWQAKVEAHKSAKAALYSAKAPT